MLFLISQIVLDSIKDESLRNDVLVQLLEPESLYIKISNRWSYFYMGYIPYEIRLPAGFYFIEYANKKDSLVFKEGYIYKIRFEGVKTGRGEKVSYEYSVRKEFNKDIMRDSCYIVLTGSVDSVVILYDNENYSYKVPSEFMFPAKKTIRISARDFQKELFLEPQFIYYIEIK